MQLQTTFIFVIVASCSLMLIFYFMSGEMFKALPSTLLDTSVSAHYNLLILKS